METLQAYLDRKSEEIALLNGLLKSDRPPLKPTSVAESIEEKFRLAAELRADAVRRDWALTETHWTNAGRPHSGPFEFNYDYQRADLQVSGPSFYQLDESLPLATVYTSAGMGAISALLMAIGRVFSNAEIVVHPESYAETIELVDSFATHLRRLPGDRSARRNETSRTPCPRILFLDSCLSTSAFEALLGCVETADLLVFDTTCFSSGSSRIKRVIRRAIRSSSAIVLVRSHTKLDSLGIEYGRLGSATFISSDNTSRENALRAILAQTKAAVRLFGSAAVPAHFPPYVAAPNYRSLSNRRGAALLRNGHRASRHLSRTVGREMHFTHGLYVTLRPTKDIDEGGTRQLVEKMCSDIRRGGLPLHHAGSFGFDFASAEWARDAVSDQYVVRIAFADLPTAMSDEICSAIASWWKMQERR